MEDDSRPLTPAEQKAALAAIPLDSLIVFPLAEVDLEMQSRLRLGIDRLRQYVQAAEIQNNRLWACQRESDVALKRQWSTIEELQACWQRKFERQWQAATELHFYFVCWDAVAKLLKALCTPHSTFGTPDRIYNRYKDVLWHYQKARDHCEHYEERLPKGPKFKGKMVITENGGQSVENIELIVVPPDGMLTFHGETWDVSAESVKRLKGIVDDFEDELRKEATLRYRKWIREQRAKAPKSIETD